MEQMKAYRVEREFRRLTKYGRMGSAGVLWDQNAAPHMDGLTFKEGYLLVVTPSRDSSLHLLCYHHGGFRSFTETRIDQRDIDRLVGEKLIRELS